MTSSDVSKDLGPKAKPSSIKAKVKDLRCQGELEEKKAKANNYHEIYMYTEHLANANDFNSLSDIFSIGKLCAYTKSH